MRAYNDQGETTGRERERERESFIRVICLLTEHEGCKVCYGHMQGHM